jgi:alpha-L-fucosidase
MEYQNPDWYRDAKFGVCAHWGPQSAPEMGDW